jgi:hypothetical protein
MDDLFQLYRLLSNHQILVDLGDCIAVGCTGSLDIRTAGVELGPDHIHMRAVAAVGLGDSHSVLALEHEDLVRTSQARIELRARHRDCEGQERLEGSMRDVVGFQCSFQVLAQAARKDSVGDELVEVERVVLARTEQVVLGKLRGQQVDKTEVSKVLVSGYMGVDVTSAMRQRPERHMGWTWGRC